MNHFVLGEYLFRSRQSWLFIRFLNAIADDLSSAELTLGGADLGTAAVTIDVTFGGTSKLVEEGNEKGVPVFICGHGE
jgi:hypothetical protein